ncbi:MAG: hypothetical protein HC822_26150 [Oscillochloris sp.]|nr:hypothetical protein [Oscillochloris sp.]
MTQRQPASRQSRWTTNSQLKGWIIGLVIVLGVLLIVVLALFFGWLQAPRGNELSVPTLDLPGGAEQIDSGAGTLGGGADLITTAPAPNPAAQIPPQAEDAFLRFYALRGSDQVFGMPIGEVQLHDGRAVRYYERMRLEYWPEYAGTAYEVQLGRLGSEYTAGRDFPDQSYFAGRDDLVYFVETGHGLGEPFLSYWRTNGGLDMFGYPISDAFEETLPGGERLLVQYFERARFEYHPDAIDPAWQVQLGRLGAAIYNQEPRPSDVPPAPTVVP